MATSQLRKKKMPKGQYNRKPRKNGGQEIEILMPETNIVKASWFEKLDENEKGAVKAESEQLAVAMLNFGRSRLSIGEHLSKLRDVLEPHNVFGKFLKNFHFSKRTAYRYIRGFENAQARLPEPILKAAMVRGMAIIGESDQKPLGIYTEAAKQLPPPNVANETQAQAYLDSLDMLRKTSRGTEPQTTGTFAVTIPQDPETLLKECYRFVSSRYKKLPTNHKTRSAWVDKLVGMVLNELGVSGTKSFHPIAIPEGYKAERGRPRAAAA
jgi:hypothetical protein